MPDHRIILIAAIGRNRELGKGNDLIWKIPDDLKRFRDLTRGHPIIMGRKTYESLPRRPLPDRTNIVVTRSTDYGLQTTDFVAVPSIEKAIETAKNAPGADAIFVIGGGQIYEAALPYANELELTIVDAEDAEASVFFPPYEEVFPHIVSDELHEWEGLRYRWQTRRR
jgi:dihydrofolate reductase